MGIDSEKEVLNDLCTREGQRLEDEVFHEGKGEEEWRAWILKRVRKIFDDVIRRDVLKRYEDEESEDENEEEEDHGDEEVDEGEEGEQDESQEQEKEAKEEKEQYELDVDDVDDVDAMDWVSERERLTLYG